MMYDSEILECGETLIVKAETGQEASGLRYQCSNWGSTTRQMDPQWPLLTPDGAAVGVQWTPNARGPGDPRSPNEEVQGVTGPPMIIDKGSDLA
jgi:hypothetical protein